MRSEGAAALSAVMNAFIDRLFARPWRLMRWQIRPRFCLSYTECSEQTPASTASAQALKASRAAKAIFS